MLTGLVFMVFLSVPAFAFPYHGHDKIVIINKNIHVTNVHVTHVTQQVTNTTNVTNVTNEVNPTNLFGVKGDAPKLVHLYGDWYLGAEGGKDLNYTNASDGWFAYAKVTYEGTLFDFSKK